MSLIEFRIKLPIATEKYPLARLHTTMDLSKELTNSRQGVKILENTLSNLPCYPTNNSSQSCGHLVQRTSKRYYLPDSLTTPLGVSGCVLREDSFNNPPNSRTTVTADYPSQPLGSVEFTVDTIVKNFSTDTSHNIFRLPHFMLDKRSVVDIDIVNDSLDVNDSLLYNLALVDPKTILGLKDDWQDHLTPNTSTILYKLVIIKSDSKQVTALIKESLQKLFLVFHQKLVCSHDRWTGLNIDDIRTMESETTTALKKRRES
jgi:hypothetical protein